jgi:hypothetical protein
VAKLTGIDTNISCFFSTVVLFPSGDLQEKIQANGVTNNIK